MRRGDLAQDRRACGRGCRRRRGSPRTTRTSCGEPAESTSTRCGRESCSLYRGSTTDSSGRWCCRGAGSATSPPLRSAPAAASSSGTRLCSIRATCSSSGTASSAFSRTPLFEPAHPTSESDRRQRRVGAPLEGLLDGSQGLLAVATQGPSGDALVLGLGVQEQLGDEVRSVAMRRWRRRACCTSRSSSSHAPAQLPYAHVVVRPGRADGEVGTRWRGPAAPVTARAQGWRRAGAAVAHGHDERRDADDRRLGQLGLGDLAGEPVGGRGRLEVGEVAVDGVPGRNGCVGGASPDLGRLGCLRARAPRSRSLPSGARTPGPAGRGSRPSAAGCH